VKIVHEEILVSCGEPATSQEWKAIRDTLHEAVSRVSWPPRSKLFTIYPESGRKSGEGNGVKPIKAGLITQLRVLGWQIEGEAKNPEGRSLGRFDAVYQASFGACVLEWETGNISSSHRSLNKMMMLVSSGVIATGTLIVPSRELYKYLTDRVGNYQELEPYLGFWRLIPCKSGVVEIVVVEHDRTSKRVPRIGKGTDGRALG
jgi:hypothetical protein